MIRLRDSSQVLDARLDRLVHFDVRSLDWPIRAILGDEQQQPVTNTWSLPAGSPVLDQGQDGACFPPGTLIRMADGSHKRIEDIRLLDDVVTAEGNTGPVMQLFVRKAKGLVRVRLDGHNLLRCTPEHPILTQRGYVRARDLDQTDKVAVVRYMAEADDGIRPHELVSLKGLRGVLSGEVNTGGVISTIAPLPELLGRTPALGRLLGLYAAEGCITANKVVWTYGGHEEHTLVPETVDLIKTVFDSKARVQRRPSGAIVVVLYGRAWMQLFNQLVPGTTRQGDKRLSEHVTHGSQEYLTALLEGWLAGDGYRRRTERSGVSVSRQLALDMQAIANALGLRPILRTSAPAMNAHAQTRQTRYDLSFGTAGGSNRSSQQTEAAVWHKVRSVEAEADEGYVYNIEVQGDHSYVADGVGVHNCVGFGITNELRFNPVPVAGLDDTYAVQSIYWGAQRRDQWPGGEYPGAAPVYQGSSVLAGIHTAAALGFYGEYRWAFGEPDAAVAVSHVGPVIIGINWYETMFTVDPSGFLNVGGQLAGGHCTLLVGINVDTGNPANDYYGLYNSWGPGWGNNGTARLRRADLDRLLHEDGEAAVVTQRFDPTAKPAT